ncbi:MAG: NAD(P)H-hydrate dehydratase [Candidatus Acidulodesulfobacterium sp.]
MELYFSDGLKKIDEESYAVFGYSENILMENAGGGCYREFLKLYDKNFLKKASIAVVCGKGNNGGDGFVFSRCLFNSGLNVNVVVLADKASYKGIAGINLDILVKLGAVITEIPSEDKIPDLENILEKADVVADAIFGVGLNRELTGFFKKVIEIINEKSFGYDIICIDVPSGLNADTGEIMNAAITENIKKIFTFGGLKAGFYINYGEKLLLNEKTVLIDINQPRQLLKKYGSGIEIITEKEISRCFKERKKTSTKFDYGHLLIVAGSSGKTGAAFMSSLAGFKSGAGLVTAAVPERLNDIMEEKTDEVMTYPVDDGGKGFFIEKGAEIIKNDLLKGKNAAVIGPGIGLKEETKVFLRKLLSEINIPAVLDADALNILSEDTDILKQTAKKTDLILTPHFKEMERLSGIDRHIIEEDPIGLGKKFVKEFGVYLVLKSSSMFIFDKNGEHVSIQCGHSSLLASGGSGDVLGGLIGGFISGGMSIYMSMKCAAFILVYSAKNMEKKYGYFGAGAVKIAENIPFSLNFMLSEAKELNI